MYGGLWFMDTHILALFCIPRTIELFSFRNMDLFLPELLP